jgi:ABC-type branched-subunit amino acid transport system permease subunit
MNENASSLIKRLLACIAGGLVLALMVGNQEGSADDFGLAFHESILSLRVFVFIGIAVVVFLLITFYPLVRPYIKRPGVPPLVAGALAVIISQSVMNWFDPLGVKFAALGEKVADTSGLSPLTGPFYSWLAWVLFGICFVVGAAAVITRIKVLGYVVAVVGIAAAVIAYIAHADVVDFTNGIDHSFGVYADVIGFLVFAGAGITAVFAKSDVANSRDFLQRALDYRPGLLFSGVAIVWGLLAFITAGWFGQNNINATVSAASDLFKGTGVGGLATQYLAYLGLVLFVVVAVLSVVVAYLRLEVLAWANAALALVSMVLTFATLQAMTSTAAREAPADGDKWQNLGTGGWIACLVFVIFAGAMLQAASAARATRRMASQAGIDARAAEAATDQTLVTAEQPSSGAKITLPFTKMVQDVRKKASNRALLVVVVGIALFYPPTLPTVWQNVLVGQIGVYLLLAVGLNVVVGWAGLLDLGYIAFYEIGAYTTAYFVGALPGAQPPSWLHWPSFAVIPVAVIACLIAGVLLGAPTLRLRGDYLAIVTLGFGEIIQVVALNNPGGVTGGAQGPTIPHPRIDIPGIHITFGEDYLPYWYVLLIIIVIVVALFYRLENSRIGRAWAAIREDEVAAQASGVNTMRVKLLAFAIGASTSGLAGWFFSTQVGYFDPSLFTLQASILIVAYVVFGGMGSLPGAMMGAAVLTWLPQFLKSQVPQEDRQMWVGALVLAMMIFRPAGLLPAKRRRAELEGLDRDEQTESTAVPRAGAM